MQWWDERQRQERLERELFGLENTSKNIDASTYNHTSSLLTIVLVLLGIVRLTVARGWKFWQWQLTFVDILDGLIFVGVILVIFRILSILEVFTLPLKAEVIRLKYRIEAIEKEGESL